MGAAPPKSGSTVPFFAMIACSMLYPCPNSLLWSFKMLNISFSVVFVLSMNVGGSGSKSGRLSNPSAKKAYNFSASVKSKSVAVRQNCFKAYLDVGLKFCMAFTNRDIFLFLLSNNIVCVF